MLKNIQASWEAVSSKNKKRIVFATAAVVAILFLSRVYSERVNVVGDPTAKKKKISINLDSPELAKERWTELSERELNNLSIRLQKLEEKLETEGKETPRISKSIKSESKESLARKLDELIAKAPIKKSEMDSITPPVPMKKVRPSKDDSLNKPEQPRTIESTPRTAVRTGERASSNATQPTDQTYSGSTQLMSIIVSDSSSGSSVNDTPAENGTIELASAFVPAGTFIPGMLLTGIDAPCGARAQSGPHPVLIRLQDLSFLPNEVRQDWKGCFVLGEGYGELSSERAYIRLINLSCVDKQNDKVLDMPIKGYVADQDSKNGLRGEVVSKQGVFVARTLMAAFVEGVAEGFNRSQQTIVTTDSGTVSSNEIDNFSDGFRTGFSSGASDAAKKLSDFYMDLAEDIFPVIEIGGQRHLTLILTEGIGIKFDKQLYAKGRIKNYESL
jgi:conjugal transfer pilus assembly protein TraB